MGALREIAARDPARLATITALGAIPLVQQVTAPPIIYILFIYTCTIYLYTVYIYLYNIHMLYVYTCIYCIYIYVYKLYKTCTGRSPRTTLHVSPPLPPSARYLSFNRSLPPCNTTTPRATILVGGL